MKNLYSLRTRTLAFIIGCLLFSGTSRAQYVTITDSAFVSYLAANFPACMTPIGFNQALMDTTCPEIVNAVTVNVSNMGIQNFYGIDFFKNLDTLICSYNTIGYFDQLPASLVYLDCSDASISLLPPLPPHLTTFVCAADYLLALPALPASLTWLDCSNAPFDTLPPLPAGLQVLNCQWNLYMQLPASLPPGLTGLSCSHDYLDSLPPLPATLTTLNCDHNNLSRLPALQHTALNLLNCEQNALTALPALPPTLVNLRCDLNQITSLPALPDSLETLFCFSNKLTSLPALPNTLVYLFCYSNQIASMPALPDSLLYLQCYQNQLTSMPPLPPKLSTFNCSYNQIPALGDVPQTAVEVNVDNNQITSIQSLPLNGLHSLTVNNNPGLFCLPPIQTCALYTAGSIDIAGTGITCLPNYIQPAPYAPIPDVDALPVCSVTNTNNCEIAWNIFGSIYDDANGNCIQDSGEQRLPYVKVNLYQGANLLQSAYFLGYYSFKTDTGTYRVAVDTANLPFVATCKADTTLTLTTADSLAYGVNFGLQCKPGFDVGAQSIFGWSFRPGTITGVYISAGDFSSFYNARCAAGVSGTVTVTLTGPVKYVSAANGALIPSSVSGNTLTYNIADYSTVNFFNAFNIIVATDSNAVLGQQVCVSVSVTPATGDYNPANNNLSQCFIVTNSYDPNFKEASAGAVDTGGWITYTIHFQNTGTDTAFNISVLDTLDPNLDASTFQVLSNGASSNSRQSTTQLLPGGVIKFTLSHINLPDSGSNFLASQGFVQFKVKLKSGALSGAQVSNTGYIFFDLNAAVPTNTVTSTIGTTGIVSVPYQDFAVKIYPNPATNRLFISYTNLQPQWIVIYDVNGQQILGQKFTPQLDIAALSAGIYFIEVKGTEGTSRNRFVKM